MKCPKCSGERVGNIAGDTIPCCECKTNLVIEYWLCADCNITFRMINGKYFDSFALDQGTIKASVRDLSQAVHEIGKGNKENMGKTALEDSKEMTSMTDMLHKCLKCGESFVQSEPCREYKCPHCGFEWEVLG